MDNGDVKLSTVTEDYLKLIWSAIEAGGDGISVNDLAARAAVVASTASENVARLKAQGLVSHEPYRKVHLTEEGRAVAVGMIRRHRLLETYLHDKLGFNWDEVHEEAEILEHAVSERLLRHLDEALGMPARDPHGDPIPAEDGSIRTPSTLPLTELSIGTWARVARLSDEPEMLRALDALGVRLDDRIRRVEDLPGGGQRVEIVAADAAKRGPREVEMSEDLAATVSVTLAK